METNIIIRQSNEDDCQTIFDFIKQLAVYEKLENEVIGDCETLYNSLFVNKEAEVILAEENGVCVGFALYFFNFSTFECKKGLYLEDLFVSEHSRGKGYGKALLLHLANLAKVRGCRRMEWIVLDWNQKAIDIYKSFGASPMSEWTIYRLDHSALLKLND